MPSPVTASCNLVILLTGTQREISLQMEIAFINVNFLYRWVTSSFLMSISQKLSDQNNFYAKDAYSEEAHPATLHTTI